ncbi:hypothetical protein EDC04DRAFT_2908852 [Pisolithus marmoratus]|nr:hypothetical protein EDC04DRAFT_2908852 [Pisolithus marmoratus]
MAILMTPMMTEVMALMTPPGTCSGCPQIIPNQSALGDSTPETKVHEPDTFDGITLRVKSVT